MCFDLFFIYLYLFFFCKSLKKNLSTDIRVCVGKKNKIEDPMLYGDSHIGLIELVPVLD